jgi:peptide/nickel transport system substrate-binding protein
MKRPALGLAAALFAGALLAGAASPAAMAETLRWARSGDALTMDPHSQNEGPTNTMHHHIYETLVTRDNAGTLIPRLATEWMIKEGDPTTWVFKLREGVKFHDGADFTAEDVVFSINRVLEDTSDFKGLHSAVEGVSAADDFTVEIKLSGPSPLYPNNLTNTFMMDSGWAEANNVLKPQDFANNEESFAVRNANGTGPYVLDSRDPGVKTEMSYFEGHWDEAPDVTKIIYTPIKENATRVAALLSGEVDFVQDVPVQDIERLSGTDGIKVTRGPENRTIFFAYDMASDKLRTASVDDNPFKKPQVREALALALDREAIKQVVMRGEAIPTGVQMPPFVNGWTEELDKFEQPNPDRAKELLAEAGYPDGFSVDFNCPNDRYINDEAICQAYVGMLARIGVTANLVSQSKTLHFPLIQNRETDFYLLGWGVPPFDSSYIFNFLVHTKGDALGGWNGSGYSNPELDEKIRAIETEVDLDKRNATIAEIWEQIQKDRVFLAVHNQVLAYAMKDNITIEVDPENQAEMYFTKID